jgi:DNA repair protein RecO (recombination protein O)
VSELYRDVGVVLRTYKLRESDRIVVLMTEEHGKVRAVAKGVRKTKSKFGARLEPMSHVRLLLYRGRELDIVSQAESVEPLAPLLSSLDRASQGMAAIEAVDQLGLEREPNPRLYRMAVIVNLCKRRGFVFPSAEIYGGFRSTYDYGPSACCCCAT